MSRYDSPKYWDPIQQRVVDGVQVAIDSVPLRDIFGSYRWVWNDEATEEIHPGDFGCENTGLVLKASKRGGKLIPSSVRGTFDCYQLHAKVKGFRQIKVGRNIWEIKYLDTSHDQYTSESVMEDGNIVRVLNMNDDDGHPFLEFEWNGGWSGCAQVGAALIAKRETKGGWTGLSDAERKRLGIGMSYEEVRRLGLKAFEADLHSEGSPVPVATQTEATQTDSASVLAAAEPVTVAVKRKLESKMEEDDRPKKLRTDA
ncbi:hypothetical protein ABKN59_001462 [Abortiporus biennis]